MKSVSMGSYQYKNQVNGEFFAYLWVILLYFSLESRLIPAVLELCQLLWKLFMSRIWQLSPTVAVKQEFESVFQAVYH